MTSALEALRSLGLTEYGARIYEALVTLGPSTAPAIAEAANVPRTKVYGLLSDLATRGWIDEERSRPKRYRARRPRDCFARERARLDGLLRHAEDTLEGQYSEGATRFAGPIWLLVGPEAVTARALEMVRRARQELLLVASFPFVGDAELARALREASRRGVHVRVVVPSPDAPQAHVFAAAGGEMRMGPMPPIRVLVMDTQQALVIIPSPGADGTLDYRGVWNPSADLVGIMASAFAPFWMNAEPVPPGVPGERTGGTG